MSTFRSCNKTCKLYFLLFILFSAFLTNGDVFTLWPFSGKGGGASPEMISEAVPGTKVMTEPVSVNGKKLSLGITLIDRKLPECLNILKKLYPKASFAANGGSALIQVKLPDGTKRKIYLIQVDGIYPVIQFAMDIPAKLPKSFDWPSQLPLPSASTPLTYMHFPKRNAHYGHFKTELSADAAMMEVEASLVANNWQTLTSARPSRAGGEIFIRENPPAIMVVNIAETNDNFVKGSIYMRPLK